MNKDEYGEVKNGDITYQEIAGCLNAGRACIIGWTDEMGTHFDILFTYKAVSVGRLQGGVRGSDLFVSIMRHSAFGFGVNNLITHPDYYAEKLGLSGPTGDKVGELVLGVIQALQV